MAGLHLKIPILNIIILLNILLGSYLNTSNIKGWANAQVGKPTPNVYLCMGQLNTVAGSFRKINDLQTAGLVGGASIDPEDDLHINEDLIKQRVELLFPNINDSGLAVLDWEGEGIKALKIGRPESAKFMAALNEYKKAIKFCKKLRPNVKWGYYGLPFRDYWNTNKSWVNACLALKPLLYQCDFIAPSLYSLYPDSSHDIYNQKYVEANVNIALRIGYELNKPVYPFVWHRFSNWDLLTKDEFATQLKRIVKQRYRSKKINTVIWYGEDIYSYNIKDKKIRAEVSRYNDLDDFLGQLIKGYGSILLTILKQEN